MRLLNISVYVPNNVPVTVPCAQHQHQTYRSRIHTATFTTNVLYFANSFVLLFWFGTKSPQLHMLSMNWHHFVALLQLCAPLSRSISKCRYLQIWEPFAAFDQFLHSHFSIGYVLLLRVDFFLSFAFRLQMTWNVKIYCDIFCCLYIFDAMWK